MKDAEVEAVARPVRIQRKRSRGWQMPPNTVYVGRPTKWGNPFIVGRKNPYGTITKDRRHAWHIYLGFAPLCEELVAAAQAELKGKNLACWCPIDNPYEDCCHAAVLLKIANDPAALDDARKEPK